MLRYDAAIDYGSSTFNGSHLDITIMYNNSRYVTDDPAAVTITGSSSFGGFRNRPRLQRLAKTQSAAVNAFIRATIDPRFKIVTSWISSMPKPETHLSIDVGSLLGPIFYTWTLQLLLPIILQNLVAEKAGRQRLMMRMHGLQPSSYVFISLSWWLLVCCIYFLCLIGFGAAIGLLFFRKNSTGILIVNFFLFSIVQVGEAYVVSTFIHNTKTAVVAGFLWVFVSGFIADALIPLNKGWVIALELLPSFGLYRTLYEFGSYAVKATYAKTTGMQPYNLSDKGNGLPEVWAIFAVEGPLLILLGVYLELVRGFRWFASKPGLVEFQASTLSCLCFCIGWIDFKPSPSV